MIRLAKQLARSIVRHRTPVVFNDLSAVKPVSSAFGHERGTPIDRHYIEAFLSEQAAAITGRAMEVGGARYLDAFGKGVTAREVLHVTADNPEATIVGDLTVKSSLPAATLDCIVCTQTLGFIYDVRAAVEGLAYVLKPGGVALVTVGGISQISRYDMERWGDYWRFTDASLRRLFEPCFGSVDVTTYGNVTAGVAFLQGIAVEDLPDRRVLDHRDPDYQVVLAVCARRPR